jgi:tetratricopeptide (TPR) repeat protein
MRIVLLVLLCSSVAFAQFGRTDAGSRRETRLILQIRFDDDRSVGNMVDVILLNEAGENINEAQTDDNGEVQFRVPSANYRVELRGNAIESMTSEPFDVLEGGHFVVTIHVHAKKEADERPAGAPVSVLDLKAPKDAVDAFDEGQKSMSHRDFAHAQAEFQQAIKIFPSYASAYNGLGVSYIRLGDVAHGQRALENAIELDDHFALAYLNLSKLAITQKDLKAADTYLQHAVALDPQNPEPLMLASQVDLLEGKYDAAIDSAAKVHALPHKQFAIVHFMAARAYMREGKHSDAVAQYKLFLQESPPGPAADRARAEMQAAEKQPR